MPKIYTYKRKHTFIFDILILSVCQSTLILTLGKNYQLKTNCFSHFYTIQWFFSVPLPKIPLP